SRTSLVPVPDRVHCTRLTEPAASISFHDPGCEGETQAPPARGTLASDASARQTEDPLCDHVPLDLRRPTHDRLGARVEESATPRVVPERDGAQHLERQLLEALIGLAAEHLLDRALRARVPRPLELREAPVPRQPEQLDVDPRAGEAVAQDRIGERPASR